MIKTLLKKIIPEKILGFYNRKKIQNKQPRKKLRFEVHLAEHCNLNCKGCDNFSPLAQKEFADVKIFKKDLARLAVIFKNEAEEIVLLGGEPLLHPNINEFICISKEHFPESKITIITNGILLEKQKEEFWQLCCVNKVKILVTKYPVKINYEIIESIAAKYNVDFVYTDNTKEVEKTLFCLPMDLEGKQDIKKSFALCHRGNNCISLMNGKLFPCTVAPNIRHFNSFFKTNLKVVEKDYIDIYKSEDPEEILKFLSQPIPFCRYCNIEKTYGNIKWEVSQKNIQEWTL